MKFRLLSISLVTLALCGSFMFSGCSKKQTLPEIKEWVKYQDPMHKLEFSYPKGWVVNAEGGKVSVYSSQAAAQKFFDFTAKVEDGVRLIAEYQKLDTIPEIDAYVDGFKNDQVAAGYKIQSVEVKKLDGAMAKVVSYSGLMAEGAKLAFIRYIAIKDSVLLVAEYSAFNDMFEPNKAILDSLVSTLTLSKPKTVAGGNPALPSTEFDTFDNFAVRVLYPSNFETSTPRPKGDIQFALDIKGYRQDCSVHLDIRPAQKLSVEKVFEQNVKFFQARSKGETKIDGQKVLYVNYSPQRNIDARAYFFVKNDKMVRIISSYVSSMKDDFLPAFEKIVNSIKIK